MSASEAPQRVAVCSRSFSRHAGLRSELLARCPQVTFNDKGSQLAGEELVEYLAGHDGAIVALEKLDDDVLGALPELRIVGKYGVGLDKLDLAAMERRQVRLGWTPGVNAQAVAELTLAMALALVRRLPEASAVVSEGGWRQIVGGQLHSRCYGILGCGHVGRALARLLQPFGCRVIAHDIAPDIAFFSEQGIDAVSFEDLFEEADVVSIHVPLNEATRRFVDARALARMKATSVLINTARGGLVDEAALESALGAGQLAGAALDVLEQEPPSDNAPLLRRSDVIVTPHIGGSSEEAILAMGRAAIDGLYRHREALWFDQFR